MKIINLEYERGTLSEPHEFKKSNRGLGNCWWCGEKKDIMICLEGVGDGFFNEYLCPHCIKKLVVLLGV